MFIVLAVHKTTQGMVTLPVFTSSSLGAARNVIPRLNNLNSRSKITDVFIYSVDPDTTYDEDGTPFRLHQNFDSQMIDQRKRNWEWWRHRSVCSNESGQLKDHRASPNWFLYKDEMPFDLEADRVENETGEIYHEEF